MNNVSLPPQVERLAWRQRELATIVYSLGAATVKDVQARASSEISDTTVRSILRRMVAKGILRRQGDGKGHSQELVYAPAITDEMTRQAILIQIADLYFEGSVARVASTAWEVAEKRGRGASGIHKSSKFKRGTAIAPLPAEQMRSPLTAG